MRNRNLYNNIKLITAIKIFFGIIVFPITVLLIVFNLRRIIFSITILLPSKASSKPRNNPKHRELPEVLILIPCRDEENIVSGLCQALKQLDYPEEKRQIVLIDDGSTDHTRELFEQSMEGEAGWQTFAIAKNVGKANAINETLKQFSFGKIIFIYDADHRPEPESLKIAVRYFDDASVGGVSGRTIPINGFSSPSAYYATVESLVHQLVTMRAKDRLGLAPALLGSNCGYRRTALEACGGFKPGAFLEDSDLTLSFYRHNYRIRFVEESVAYHQVPGTVTGYLKQHIRWGRGFNMVSQDHLIALIKDNQLPRLLRIELALFAAGYLDRVALLSALGLAGLHYLTNNLFFFPIWVVYVALIVPFLQVIMLLIEQRSSIAMWQRVLWIPIFYVLDIYAALRGLVDTILKRPLTWSKTERI